MSDAQSDGRSSSPLAYVTSSTPSSIQQATSPCEAAHPSLISTAFATMLPSRTSPDSMTNCIVGKSGNPSCCGSQRPASANCTLDGPQDTPRSNRAVEQPKISFEDLASQYRQNQHKQAGRKRLEARLHATKVFMGVSARLIRVGAAAQRALVDRLRHDDKPNFITLYHTLVDLQESCDATFWRQSQRQDPLEELSPIRESVVDRPPDFFLQLSPQSRTDLLDILHLVRTDPQFVFERLRALTPTQRAAFVSSTGAPWESGSDLSSSAASRSRSHGIKRSLAASLSYKDRILALERKDPLSILLFDIFASPLDSDGAEARLRLNVWSSVCAKLLTQDGNGHGALIPHILTAWATASEWKAKPKFELYLMDMLQSGAFLLEHVETPPGLKVDMEPLDPLRTDVAEEFFTAAVDALFQLLDDPDGGFPEAVMQLSCAILRKLDRPDDRNRFFELLFVQWFFAKYLYGALTFPEAHGLLLDFHVRDDAREKLLGQVGLRAYSQVYAILRSMHHYSVRLTVRRRVESMLSRFQTGCASHDLSLKVPSREHSSRQQSPAGTILLSAADVLTLLNTLYSRSSTPTCTSPKLSSGASAAPSVLSNHPERPMTAVAEPGFFKPVHGSFPRHASQCQNLFASAVNFSHAEQSISRNADRIRFELSEMCGLDGRAVLEPPAAEEWAVFSVSEYGKLVWGLFTDDCRPPFLESIFVEDTQSAALELENNFEALQTAIVKLILENPADDGGGCDLRQFENLPMVDSATLKQRFDKAMNRCHHESDFIGAHYWWNAGRQLLRSTANSPDRLADDTWILEPMHKSCIHSLRISRAVIERCESELVALHRQTQRLQKMGRNMMATVAKLRDKMWYMTDVKNSMRYEDAKNVALALKTMIYSARMQRQTPNEVRSRGNARAPGGSFLQKPELQVMNIMKAPSSQGGPNKLSDEQVDLISKWLSHNNIDNFCKGEERIHRFCYEVQASINRLVGESMAETPVLWASELYHRERVKYEGSSYRNFLGLSSIRSFVGPGEDSAHLPQGYGNQSRPADSGSRYSSGASSLDHKASYQSLLSDKWKGLRDPSVADTSSIGGSPGRAASTATGDSYSTFWSTSHQPAQYAPSSSSIYSRPPSTFSDNSAPPACRNDRKTQDKAAFIDDLKQTLTSLLLSDLGSPVWSCGSETDAWFGNALNQQRIQTQMKKRARLQRFYTECDEHLVRNMLHRVPSDRARSKSLGPADRTPLGERVASASGPSYGTRNGLGQDTSQFSYSAIFHRLIEVFSRHGNPFVKLKALRDLRALVVALLNTTNEELVPFSPAQDPMCQRGRSSGVHGKRNARHSFSESQAKRVHEKDASHAPTSAVAESVIFDCRPSDYSGPTEHQIVDALRGLLLEVKPKTLFRDLQFISAFVPSETLNQTDSGTSFLQFGLAALSLKDEVCNSMVEIADSIVSQELSRRHPTGYESHPGAGHAIEDAAGMWIITAKEGNPVAQRELAILYLTHPELLPRVTLPLTLLRDTFKAEMMYRRDKDSKSDPQSMCLALHWMQLSATGGDELARNWLREREEFELIV
ncbi:uncharacterized protein BP01DRAFT_302494 [Aspergillus saccharolyticus JOP 1030-1]|uniref:Uncharacterized protein n=1 Tax=Aspergillus saccharolyticus JOP 1030-1 TaxID=1450539 RepID=A0A318Z8P3_9EURO|nr:hypothetical protein BP01DRAFT_302494 [Aspergillus saccharolyticus JOP 1030-1]PYH42764.1 hypothetical protein BP01DRAFT_302494 [Aspergillus saccharolyticus JOP 1030-1]